jgi:hypothetical protein
MPPSLQGHKPEVVAVLQVMPMSQAEAKVACASDAAAESPGEPAAQEAGFCVVYGYQGQSYSVVLPNDPGETLTLQIPVTGPAPVFGAPMPVAAIGVAPYALPYSRVYFYGGYYRPRAYVPSSPNAVPTRTLTRPVWRNRRG